MFWFTSDEHYGHRNIIKYSNRPFSSIEEMDSTLISNNNSVVGKNDTVVHAGDFSLIRNPNIVYKKYVSRLVGNHIFLKGSHDYWLKKNKTIIQIWERNINGHYVVVCHYAMRVWARSHYNSWQLYGHSHNKLDTVGKQYDIGVDNNHHYLFPISFDQIVKIMKYKPNNFNLIKEKI